MNTQSAISTILKEGTIISTRFSTENTWYQNIVYKIDGNCVYTALTNSYLENIIMPGINILVKSTNEYFEYVFEGTVSEIKLDDPAYVVIKINRSEEIINTRAFPRFDIYLATTIKPQWEQTTFFSVVTNISLAGMAFLSKHDFEYGEENEIWVYLPSQRKVYAKGKVIRKSVKGDLIDYSMQFIEMDDANNNLLSNYLNELDEKVEKIKNEFFHLIKTQL